jgi:drug/metabolite transporter (DMT)-like permease
MNNRTLTKPVIVLFLGILSVSTASIFIRFAQRDVPSLVIAAYRMSIATLLITPFVLYHRRSELAYLRGKNLVLVGLSGFFLAVHFATWITSLELTTVASSVVLVTTTPLWVALFSVIILKEPLHKTTLLGMMIALSGGLIIGFSDFCYKSGNGFACPDFQNLVRGEVLLGDFLALTGAVMAAMYLIIGRKIRANISLLSYIFPVYGISALFLLALVILLRMPAFGFANQAYLWLLLLAFIPQLIGHTSFNWALRFLSAGYVSIALLGEPIGTTILAMIFLGEMPTFVKIIGGTLIFVGILLASRFE